MKRPCASVVSVTHSATLSDETVMLMLPSAFALSPSVKLTCGPGSRRSRSTIDSRGVWACQREPEPCQPEPCPPDVFATRACADSVLYPRPPPRYDDRGPPRYDDRGPPPSRGGYGGYDDRGPPPSRGGGYDDRGGGGGY